LLAEYKPNTGGEDPPTAGARRGPGESQALPRQVGLRHLYPYPAAHCYLRFLEDGDLHTDYKRERQFKWANLDDQIDMGPGPTQGDEEMDEAETLEKWRLEKMEKEKWLKEQETKGAEDEEEDSQFFKMADATLQRMTSKEEEEQAGKADKVEGKVFKSPQGKNFGPLRPIQNGPMRGSFLARDAASLDRLERFNKTKEEKVGAVAKGRNFVFATISPPKEKEVEVEEEKGGKGRKAGGGSKAPAAKKPKINRNLDENSRTIFNLL
jgi:hypothetical protein